jgi:hypothetical protein
MRIPCLYSAEPVPAQAGLLVINDNECHARAVPITAGGGRHATRRGPYGAARPISVSGVADLGVASQEPGQEDPARPLSIEVACMEQPCTQ